MSSKKRRVCFSLDSRATYGYAKNVLKVLSQFDKLEYRTIVLGGHLSKKHGYSIKEIIKDNIRVDEKVKFDVPNKSFGWSFTMGKAISKISMSLEKIKPDIVLIFGDRIETLSVCLASVYMNIPVAHIQAGDKSGHIDDSARYAIAKLSHLHFASCLDSKNRLLKLGEQRFRIFNTGAPQLDNIREDARNSSVTNIKLKKFIEKKFILVLFHPVLNEKEQAGEYMKNILKSCLSLDMNVLCIFPNTDSGSELILSSIKKFTDSKLLVYSNIKRELFLHVLNKCFLLIGNSSAGILEAPSFKKPVINIGIRQRGRPQSYNIINCDYDVKSIMNALMYVKNNKKFHQKCKTVKNLYGDGKSGYRICDILNKIEINKKLLDKQIIY
ncbi:MAG: UDP-N-acetylglucosamine 2-epimerase (hydrolyzing) [Pelagibacteraceae bacterium TMED65]|nr:UDP-N-acetylglucosamine 2-epimerase (hydrolyzing) [Rickettsiales bacterium]OUU50452.1 MAG: UDP-N-acetylglucosamine 2-epimerase (hydrolyzing) [Pelagibacteraceae bacterium TMED65]|tara:strand:+ start:3722 stop:4870 length:1149 start_codon:yes stop_codon:yes gene_type:complete